MSDKMEKFKKREFRQYRELIDGMNDAVFIHDLNCNFLSVNQVAVDRLGYSEEELLSMGLDDIDGSKEGKKVKDRIQEIEKKETIVFESIHVTKSGEKIPVEISSSPINYRGEPAVFSVVKDIKERKRVEEALRDITSAMVSQIGSGVRIPAPASQPQLAKII